MREVVIVSACRTPIGKFMGQFKDVAARDLAITAGKEAIRRAGIDASMIEDVAMGEVYAGMQGSLPAKQVSYRIGCPPTSNAVTVNLSMIYEMQRNDYKVGCASLCVGGGPAMASVWTRENCA